MLEFSAFLVSFLKSGIYFPYCRSLTDFPRSSVGKESAFNAGDPGLIPGLGRSPGEGNGNPFQHSHLENPMDCGLPGSSLHGVARVGHDSATKPPPLL